MVLLPQVKNEGTLPAMLTWSMQDANIDAKEAAKKVDVSLQVSAGGQGREGGVVYTVFVDSRGVLQYDRGSLL